MAVADRRKGYRPTTMPQRNLDGFNNEGWHSFERLCCLEFRRIGEVLRTEMRDNSSAYHLT